MENEEMSFKFLVFDFNLLKSCLNTPEQHADERGLRRIFTDLSGENN